MFKRKILGFLLRLFSGAIVLGSILWANGNRLYSMTYAFDLQAIKIKVDSSADRSMELQLQGSFPTENDEQEDIFFTHAWCVSSDVQGWIAVSNLRASEVFIFDHDGRFLRKIGGPGQGPGEFISPSRVVWTQKIISVLDGGNGRVQYFDENRQFKYSIKLKASYSDIAIGKNRTIYAVAFRRNLNGQIDAIGRDGEKLFSFGRVPEAIKKPRFPQTPWLRISPQDELYVAYWIAPVVQLYSTEGELRFTYEIQYKPMQDKVSWNLDRMITAPGGGRVAGQLIIEVSYASETGFFILHRDLGNRISILEFFKDGTFVRNYWAIQSPAYYPKEFVVSQNGTKKVFYILQVVPDNRVDIFREK